MEYGLIGKNLKHSYSKIIHEQLRNITYEIVDITEEKVYELLENKNFKGLNVTIPYKEKVIDHIDFLSSIAKKTNAVNTIVNKDNILYGYNTDYLGFKNLVMRNYFPVSDKTCVILGNGASAKTVKCVLEDLGVKKIYIATRKINNVSLEEIENKNLISYEQINKVNPNIIVNTTPVGMYPNINDLIIELKDYTSLEMVFDLVYNPFNTSLFYECKKNNVKYKNGLEMLIFQAIFSSEKFFNDKIDQNIFDDIYKLCKQKLMNIVLIGLPGCGKSTIAKKVSKELNMDFVDTDDIIEKEENKKIHEIFQEFSQSYFREKETQVVKKVSLLHNTVISLGGGVILREENMDFLKKNGIVIYIYRDIDKIFIDKKTRPLTLSKADLIKRYSERKDLLEKYQDKKVDNNTTIKFVVEEIKKIWNNL